MDEIEGFRQYLGVAEEDRLNALNPPEKTPELFERFLPYAVALDVDNTWAKRFASVLAVAGAAAVAQSWYSSDDWTDDPVSFADHLGSEFNVFDRVGINGAGFIGQWRQQWWRLLGRRWRWRGWLGMVSEPNVNICRVALIGQRRRRSGGEGRIGAVSEHRSNHQQSPKPRRTWSGADSTADGSPPQPTPGALRAVAIALIAQGVFRILFLAYTITTLISVVGSGTFWSDNPIFVATHVASLALGFAVIVVGGGILQQQTWAQPLGVTVCALALLGEAYAAFNIAKNFVHLGVLSTVLYAGLTGIYTAVFLLSLTVLARWRPKPPSDPWPSAQ